MTVPFRAPYYTNISPYFSLMHNNEAVRARNSTTLFLFLLANTHNTSNPGIPTLVQVDRGANHFGFSSSTLVFFHQRFYWRGSGGDKQPFGRRAECIHSNLWAEISCGSSSGYCCSGRRSVRIEDVLLRIFWFIYLLICELLICICVQ